ncbi:hydroxysqualene dehydroxylase [Marinoscillum luteum]|uniref:FAD-dependent oxidoreductase n=1 Tax=Marinoscillum luteum TaxID=861051 RepID=A0ABW7NAE7_9BACT
MKKSVIILGGGVAGMSAAHELIEKGFEVTVYERQDHLPGGKARSIPLPEFTQGNNKDLSGEHGFRFFPGFYRHLIDTMKRTPSGDGTQKSTADNLIEAPIMMLARAGKKPIQMPSGFPNSLADLRLIVEALHADTGLEEGESKVILGKIWQLMTSSKRRRSEEYEQIGWWDYCEADKYSPAYRELFVDGLTRTLVAAKAKKANTFTNGNILMQMIFGFGKPHEISDRILDGPTNEKWLYPWLDYLKKQGVNYHFKTTVVSVKTQGKEIAGVEILENGELQTKTADYYLCALPVERAAKVLATPELIHLDGRLANLKKLSSQVAWMNGIQYFLKEDVKINAGHIILADSPWALTVISQAQFWADYRWEEYGDSEVNGVLSIDVSDWDAPGVVFGKPAKDCTVKEVILEVWTQMKQNFNVEEELLQDDNVAYVYIDEAIIFDKSFFKEGPSSNPKLNKPAKYGSSLVTENDEPLLVNEVGSWSLRPESYTAIPNLFLASDYVRSVTNLATMEAANETARRAVNGIIAQSGERVPLCSLWEFKEPTWLLYYKWLDEKRYKQGLKWGKPRIKWYALPASWLLRLLGKHKYL